VTPNLFPRELALGREGESTTGRSLGFDRIGRLNEHTAPVRDANPHRDFQGVTSDPATAKEKVRLALVRVRDGGTHPHEYRNEFIDEKAPIRNRVIPQIAPRPSQGTARRARPKPAPELSLLGLL